MGKPDRESGNADQFNSSNASFDALGNDPPFQIGGN